MGEPVGKELPASTPPPNHLGSHAVPLLAARNVLERRDWTAGEDDMVRKGVATWGHRWRRIAEQLPGRSEDSIRNRWSRLKKEEAGLAGAMPAALPAPRPRSAKAEPASGVREVRVS